MHAQHTPAPWQPSGRFITDTAGNKICEMYSGEADKRLIVKAVNAYVEMVAALKQAEKTVIAYANSSGGDGVVTLQVLRAALTKAGAA